jgi:peptidoglycan/xylan/chitin deacetylase (PgdA/CDA1 family)
MDNPGYLTWKQVVDMKGKVDFANHTWSHKYLKGNKAEIEKEIETAQIQLEDHGLGKPKVFAYPYGYESQTDIQILKDKGFELAFTTQNGSIQCAKRRLVLPRIRVGNLGLSVYAL